MLTLGELREQVLGARVTRLEGGDGTDGPRLSEMAFDEGTVVRFRWASGIADQVGVDVVRIGRRRRRRPIGA